MWAAKVATGLMSLHDYYRAPFYDLALRERVCLTSVYFGSKIDRCSYGIKAGITVRTHWLVSVKNSGVCLCESKK